MKRFAILSAVVVLLSSSAVAEVGLVDKKPAEGRFVKTKHGYMVPYKAKLPGSDVAFDMLPIPGGVFRMGSPDNEQGREKMEGPAFEVEIKPFWIGKYEVTWAEYKEYMDLYTLFKEFEAAKVRKITDDRELDGVTAPTELYEPEFTFEKGEDPRQPAVTMTQYAARQYTKWLSLSSGLFYRLPTESEWEYACRAGSTTAYHFGDDPAKLGEYAWIKDNSNETTHPVGEKKPNPWGLYDMHGNAAEWVLDQMLEDGYKKFAGKRVAVEDAIVWPKDIDPRVVRGGHWENEAKDARAASRLGSDTDSWKGSDPNVPLSPWWMTDDPARGVGMRLVRQLEIPKRTVQEKHWAEAAEDLQFDITVRLEEGRGIRGLVDPDLPKAIAKRKNE